MCISSKAIEYTIRTSFTNKPIIYVRKAIPDEAPGTFSWGPWHPAQDSERNRALTALMTLNVN